MRLLLTGATGFVGRHLDEALKETDWEIVRATRDPSRARQAGWVRLDVEDLSTVRPALEGCDAAVYLVHSIDSGEDYPEREARSAEAFAEAAADAGLRRIVYLGGVAPSGKGSRHLRSRLRTGEILRSGSTGCIELRAALIVGAGGSSWNMVRDLAARLPAMLLPRWLSFSSWPVFVEDVVLGIIHALQMPQQGSAWYDLPGPERISHADLLRKVARMMGKDPRLVGVPVLTPRLSSYWIALVTRAGLPLARELVEGLQSDLDPSGRSLWDLATQLKPTELGSAIRMALEDESSVTLPSPQSVERLRQRARSLLCPA
jgi:uncharacterized protein YbjT (DUF2867 family)